ncbi:MAG: hypothetical protein ABUK19_06165 [Desulfobacteria bacterium]
MITELFCFLGIRFSAFIADAFFVYYTDAGAVTAQSALREIDRILARFCS